MLSQENDPQGRLKGRKRQRKATTTNEGNANPEQGCNDKIGKMDNRLLADLVTQANKRFGKSLSLVELNDLSIPGTLQSASRF